MAPHNNHHNNNETGGPVVVDEICSSEIYTSILGIPRKARDAKPPESTTHILVQDLEDKDDGSDDYEHGRTNESGQKPSAFARSFQMALDRSLKAPPTQLKLSGDNKGFRLLQRMGWNEKEGGLGKHRQGALLPVKTALKNDKRGLGLSKAKARITHATTTTAKSQETGAPDRLQIKNPNQRMSGMTKAAR